MKSLEYFVQMAEYVAVSKPANLDEALGIVCAQQEEDLLALNEWLAKKNLDSTSQDRCSGNQLATALKHGKRKGGDNMQNPKRKFQC